jgi:hypothetical protein
VSLNIHLLHPIAREVVSQELRPGLFRVADDHGVGVSGRFARDECGMNAAEDDRNPALPEMVGQFVGAGSGAGDGADAYDVRLRVPVYVMDAFVYDDHFNVQLLRDESSQSGQGKRRVAQRLLPDPGAVPVQWTTRREQKYPTPPGIQPLHPITHPITSLWKFTS